MTSGKNLVPVGVGEIMTHHKSKALLFGSLSAYPNITITNTKNYKTLSRQEHNGSAVPCSHGHDQCSRQSHQGSLGNVCKGYKTYFCTGTLKIN